MYFSFDQNLGNSFHHFDQIHIFFALHYEKITNKRTFYLPIYIRTYFQHVKYFFLVNFPKSLYNLKFIFSIDSSNFNQPHLLSSPMITIFTTDVLHNIIRAVNGRKKKLEVEMLVEKKRWRHGYGGKHNVYGGHASGNGRGRVLWWW